MADFYMKNKKGEFLPIEIKSILGKDLSNKLVIIRVGNDIQQASAGDLDETEESFGRAEVLEDLDNVSIVITPFQIEVSAEKKEELDNKEIFLQIKSGDDIGMLEEQIRKMYNKLKKKQNTVVVPTPIKVGDYKSVIDTIKRCDVRRQRRGGKR